MSSSECWLNNSTRSPSLTYSELEAIVEEKGVHELYGYALGNLEKHFQKHTTRSSIGFTAIFNGSRRTVVSLIPQDSNPTEGLRFQLYSHRLRIWSNFSGECRPPHTPRKSQAMDLLPRRRSRL